jgi:hypothetical protein
MPQTKPSVSNGSGSVGSSSNGTSVPTVGTGILQPAMQHRFIVRVESTPQEFTAQSISFAMNFAQKELLMMVEQSLGATTREHVVIQDWIDNPKRLVTLDIMDGNNNAIDTIRFRDCIIEQHVVEFNYALSGAVVHILSLSYDKIDLGAGKAASAFASAMSIIGRP